MDGVMYERYQVGSNRMKVSARCIVEGNGEGTQHANDKNIRGSVEGSTREIRNG